MIRNFTRAGNQREQIPRTPKQRINLVLKTKRVRRGRSVGEGRGWRVDRVERGEEVQGTRVVAGGQRGENVQVEPCVVEETHEGRGLFVFAVETTELAVEDFGGSQDVCAAV